MIIVMGKSWYSSGIAWAKGQEAHVLSLFIFVCLGTYQHLLYLGKLELNKTHSLFTEFFLLFIYVVALSIHFI